VEYDEFYSNSRCNLAAARTFKWYLADADALEANTRLVRIVLLLFAMSTFPLVVGVGLRSNGWRYRECVIYSCLSLWIRGRSGNPR
jgi:hypothetical protein